MSNDDAIQCFLSIPLFHNVCDKVVVERLKHDYFLGLMKYGGYSQTGAMWKEPSCCLYHTDSRFYVRLYDDIDEWKLCKCGTQYKCKNSSKHRCLFKRDGEFPQFCPDCSKQLIVPIKKDEGPIEYIYYYLHFKHKKHFCIVYSKRLQKICRNRRNKKNRNKRINSH